MLQSDWGINIFVPAQLVYARAPRPFPSPPPLPSRKGKGSATPDYVGPQVVPQMPLIIISTTFWPETHHIHILKSTTCTMNTIKVWFVRFDIGLVQWRATYITISC